MLRLFLMVILFSSVSSAKKDPQEKQVPSKQEIQGIHSKYLKYCEQRAQEGRSLKTAKKICQCSLKAILKNGSLQDLKMLSKKSPKSLKFKTEEEKKRSNHLLALSNLEVHSLDGCEQSLKSDNTPSN